MERTAGDLITAKYRLEEKLGSGGFGDVWLASDLDLRRPVAIKFLKSAQDEARQRFSLEAEALARLDHPNCVRVFDFGEEAEGAPFLVTQYVRGPTLDEWLMSGPAPSVVLNVAIQLADAIAHAHSRDITHRDIKPANIVITEGSTGPKAMLLDFGVAKLAGVEHADITKTGVVIGTPGYMSPEQLRAGTIGAPTDVYAFGVVLFEMFSGGRLFTRTTMLELAMAHLLDAPPSLERTPSADVRDLVGAMLRKDASTRPTLAVVARVLRGEPSARPRAVGSAERRRPTPVLAPARGYGRWIAALVTLAALIVVAFVAHDPMEPADSTLPTSQRGKVPNALVRTALPPTPPPRDAGQAAADVAGRPDGGSPGCGSAREPGVWWLDRPMGGAKVGVRIPPQYDPQRPAPVLVMFHDVLQSPDHIFQIGDLAALADRDGFVMIVPPDDDVGSTWLTTGDIEDAVLTIRAVSEALCLDMRRIYIIGHGNGGYAATRVTCAMDGVLAVAQTSHRMGGRAGERLCESERPRVPTMFISMKDDRTNPFADVPDCLGKTRWTLAEHEELLRSDHRCSARYNPRGETCQALRCEVPLSLCHPDGGRDWASMPARFATTNPLCSSPSGEFDFASAIWAFFDRVAPFAPPP